MATQPPTDRSAEIEAAFCPVTTTVDTTALSAAQLPVSLEKQRKTLWCWAAVSRELCAAKPGSKFISDADKSQETIARAILGNLENKAQKVIDVLFELFTSGWLSKRYYQSNKSGPALHAEIVANIQRGDLVSAVVEWNSQISHNVCIHGFIEGSQRGSDGNPVLSFWVYDPCADDEKLDNRYILRADAFHKYPTWDPKYEVCVTGSVTAVYTT